VNVPDPLPLRNIEVPREVTRVEGCDCGGMTLHRHDCSLRSLPPGQAQIEIELAQERLRGYTAALNRRLRESGF
jgi:hypothetical protein